MPNNPDKMKAKFLKDGEAFAKVIKAAREWEVANKTKVSAAGGTVAARRTRYPNEPGLIQIQIGRAPVK